ncbi:flagellar protein FliT [Vreelandella rituensis]|uniref:Flagellar protein FliT n=1 Tax=Vreelandella rituensis TaxID=2282306 RepID=A0A368U4W9_9GAMM|nr:flagellar protein FliT [Halomonas rituensis]RCV92065.1 flagellar protein FliT [Halomonas rituensis]
MSSRRDTQDAQDALLKAYAALLASVKHMHELAHQEQWAELIEQRTHYVLLVDELQQLDASITLDSIHSQQKADLLESILEHDVQMRQLLVERRDELGKLIGVSQRQRSLHRAYAPQQAPVGHSEAVEAPEEIPAHLDKLSGKRSL